MDKPLGKNIGNSLEVAESMAVLQGRGPADLTEVCLQLASNMLVLAGKGRYADLPQKLAEGVIADGSAFEKCCQMFAAQGGDINVLRDADKFRKAKFSYELTAPADGYIYKNDVERSATPASCWVRAASRRRTASTLPQASRCTKSWAIMSVQERASAPLYADDESLFAARRRCTVAALSSVTKSRFPAADLRPRYQ